MLTFTGMTSAAFIGNGVYAMITVTGIMSAVVEDGVYAMITFTGSTSAASIEKGVCMQ